MSHYKHFATIVVVRVGVGGVIGDVSAREGRLTLIFTTLCLIVAKLDIISALGGVVMMAWFDMVAPLSS